jgi:hypothetical protein
MGRPGRGVSYTLANSVQSACHRGRNKANDTTMEEIMRHGLDLAIAEYKAKLPNDSFIRLPEIAA